MKKLLYFCIITSFFLSISVHAQTYKVDSTFKLENPRDTITHVPEVLLLNDEYLQLYAAGNLLNGKPDQSTHVSFDISTDSTARKIFSESDSTFRSSLGNYLVTKGKNFYYLTDRVNDPSGNSLFKTIRYLPTGKRDSSFQMTVTSGLALRVYEGLNNEIFVIFADRNSDRYLNRYNDDGTFKTSISILYDVTTKEMAQIWDFAYNDNGKFFFYVRNKENQSKIIRTDANLKNRLEFKSSIKDYPKAYDYVFFQNNGLVYVVSAPLGAAREASDFQLFNSDGVLLKETSLSFGRDIGTVYEIYTTVTNNGEFRFVEYPNNWSAIDTTGKLIKYDFPANSTVVESFNNGDWLISDAGSLYQYNAVTKSKKPLGIKTENIRQFYAAKVFVQPNGNRMVEFLLAPQTFSQVIYSRQQNLIRIYTKDGKRIHEFKNGYSTGKSEGYFTLFQSNATSYVIDENLKVLTANNERFAKYPIRFEQQDQTLSFEIQKSSNNSDVFISRKFSPNDVLTDSFSVVVNLVSIPAESLYFTYDKTSGKVFVFDRKNGPVEYVMEININSKQVIRKPPMRNPFISTVNIGGVGLYSQFIEVKEYNNIIKLIGGQSKQKIGNSLIVSAATIVSEKQQHCNYLKIDSTGQLSNTLSININEDLLFFDFATPDTLYGVVGESLLRFYLTSEEAEPKKGTAIVVINPPIIQAPLANETPEVELLPFPNPTSEQVFLPISAGSIIKSVQLVLPNGSFEPLTHEKLNQQLVIELPKNIHGVVYLHVEHSAGVRSYKLMITK